MVKANIEQTLTHLLRSRYSNNFVLSKQLYSYEYLKSYRGIRNVSSGHNSISWASSSLKSLNDDSESSDLSSPLLHPAVPLVACRNCSFVASFVAYFLTYSKSTNVQSVEFGIGGICKALLDC